jgi:hypothetical protein
MAHLTKVDVEELIALWDKKKDRSDESAVPSTKFTDKDLGKNLIRSLYFSHKAISGNANFELRDDDGWKTVISSPTTGGTVTKDEATKHFKTKFTRVTTQALNPDDLSASAGAWNNNYNNMKRIFNSYI